jgi:hypothetical protein
VTSLRAGNTRLANSANEMRNLYTSYTKRSCPIHVAERLFMTT